MYDPDNGYWMAQDKKAIMKGAYMIKRGGELPLEGIITFNQRNFYFVVREEPLKLPDNELDRKLRSLFGKRYLVETISGYPMIFHQHNADYQFWVLAHGKEWWESQRVIYSLLKEKPL
jgi:hypothetical protein